MSLADSLKASTAAMHKYAESRPLQKALVAGTASRAQVALYLAQLALIHSTLEDLIRTLPHSALSKIQTCSRNHSQAIAEDLKVLDGSNNILQLTDRVVGELRAHTAERPMMIVGALYVLEGSMNGNKFIGRNLAAAFNIQPGQPGLSYWDPYGDRQPECWQKFRKALNDLHLTDAETKAVHDGAEFMFAAIAEIADAVAHKSGLVPVA